MPECDCPKCGATNIDLWECWPSGAGALDGFGPIEYECSHCGERLQLSCVVSVDYILEEGE